MDEKKILGFWKEYGWHNFSKKIEEENFFDRFYYNTEKRALEYLRSGISLIAIRRYVECIFTGEPIGSPTAYTDGEFVWTQEYIYYIQNGYLELPKNFRNHMETNHYKVPSREEVGEILIKEFKYLI